MNTISLASLAIFMITLSLSSAVQKAPLTRSESKSAGEVEVTLAPSGEIEHIPVKPQPPQALSSMLLMRARAGQKGNDESSDRKSLDSAVSAKQGKLKQTSHNRCMAAVTSSNGAESITQIKEVSCDSAEYGPSDMKWSRDGTAKQILLQDDDRNICLEAAQSSNAVYGRPCILTETGRTTTHLDTYQLQQWSYSSTNHRIMMHHDNTKCLASTLLDPTIVLQTCDSDSDDQKWQLVADDDDTDDDLAQTGSVGHVTRASQDQGATRRAQAKHSGHLTSLDASVSGKTLMQGKLKQTTHEKCLGAITSENGAETMTEIKEVDCSSTEYGPEDLKWQRHSTDRQIALQDSDRDVCLQASPSTMEVFARSCISSSSTTHADTYQLQEWSYSHDNHEIKMKNDHTKCLATTADDPTLILQDCDSGDDQKWQLIED